MTIEQLYRITGDHATEFNKYLLDNYSIERRMEFNDLEFSVYDDGWVTYRVPDKMIKYIWLEWYSDGYWNVDDEIERWMNG